MHHQISRYITKHSDMYQRDVSERIRKGGIYSRGNLYIREERDVAERKWMKRQQRCIREKIFEIFLMIRYFKNYDRIRYVLR